MYASRLQSVLRDRSRTATIFFTTYARVTKEKGMSGILTDPRSLFMK
jgi:hypothetical protein